jgi:hypothetical protein
MTWAFVAWLSMSYFGITRPRSPIPAQGRFYSYNDHGTVVYLTHGENLLIDSFEWCWWAIVLVGLLAVKFGAWDKNADTV